MKGELATTFASAQECTPDVWQALHRQVYTGDADNPPMISASNVATIMGLNHFKSAYTLFQQFRGRVAWDEETPEMRAGKASEPEVARRYEEVTKRKVYDPGDFAIHIHPEHSFIFATLDRLDNEGRAVELKSPSAFSMSEWEEGRAPLMYQIQNQVQIACADLTKGAVCAVPRGRESQFFNFDYDRHDKAIRAIIVACVEFRERIVNDDAPPIDYSASTIETLKALHPDDDGTTVEAPDMAPVIAEYMAAQDHKKAADGRLDELKAQIMARLGSATYLVADGYKLSYKTQERKETIQKASKYRVLRMAN